MKRYIFALNILIAISLFLIAPEVNAESLSLGVSPSFIRNGVLLPGSHFEQELVVSRSVAQTEETILIKIDGEVFSSWLQIDPGNEFVMKKGVLRKTVRFTFDIPEDVERGEYTGSANIGLETESEEGKIVFVPALEVDINLKVIEGEVSMFEVRSARIENFYSNDSLVLKILILNQGNVEARPDSAAIGIYDTGGEFLQSLLTEEIASVEPFSSGEIILEFSDIYLDAGDYNAQLEVLDEGKTIYKDKLSFSVLSGVGQKKVLGVAEVNEDGRSSSINPLMIIGIVGVVGIGGGSYFVWKKLNIEIRNTRQIRN
jgi:hypothetical protein